MKCPVCDTEFISTRNAKACSILCRTERQRIASCEYKLRNKEKVLAYTRKWKADRKEHVAEYNSKYHDNNKRAIQLRHNKNQRDRRKNDASFKIAGNCRNYVGKLMRNDIKRHNTSKLIGCSWEFLVDWLQSQFTGNMTMDNYGDVWHIDHCIPSSWFDLNIESEVMTCFHWSNLQPMYALKNVIKNNTTTRHEQIMQQLKEIVYLKTTLFPADDYVVINFDRMKYLY